MSRLYKKWYVTNEWRDTGSTILNLSLIFTLAIIIFTLPITQLNVWCKVDNSVETGDLDKIPKTIGIGWLEISTKYPIPVYKNSTDSLPYDILKFYIIESYYKSNGILHNDTRKWRVVFQSRTKPNVERGWGDGPTLIFRVVNVTDSIYQVVINEETFETCYINVNEYLAYNHDQLATANPYNFVYEYKNWLDYIQSFLYIEAYTIYDKPDGEIIYKRKNDWIIPCNVTDMNGNWIKVKDIPSLYYSDSVNYDGWTRWTDGENLLIGIIVEYIE